MKYIQLLAVGIGLLLGAVTAHSKSANIPRPEVLEPTIRNIQYKNILIEGEFVKRAFYEGNSYTRKGDKFPLLFEVYVDGVRRMWIDCSQDGLNGNEANLDRYNSLEKRVLTCSDDGSISLKVE